MQLLSKVFSVKMVYRQLITIILSIYKNFSLRFKVLSVENSPPKKAKNTIVSAPSTAKIALTARAAPCFQAVLFCTMKVISFLVHLVNFLSVRKPGLFIPAQSADSAPFHPNYSSRKRLRNWFTFLTFLAIIPHFRLAVKWFSIIQSSSSPAESHPCCSVPAHG